MSDLVYSLGPWVVDHDESVGDYRRAPDGSIAMPDPGSESRPDVGLFLSEQPLGSDYQQVATSRDDAMSEAARDAWQSLIGVRPESGSVVDAVRQTFTDLADPDRHTAPKPIMPTRKRILELHMPDHSLVWSRPWAEASAAHRDRVLATVRRAYAAHAQRARGNQQAAIAAGKWLRVVAAKLGASPDELRPSGSDRIQPRRPETTIEDDFNRGNESLSDGPWDNLQGDAWVVSDECRGTVSGGNRSRHTSDLSSDDHWTQMTVTDIPVGVSEAWGRSNTGGTFAAWESYLYQDRFDGDMRLFRRQGGSFTQIANTPGTSPPGTPYDIMLDVDGSTITGFQEGSQVVQTTDTTLTSGLRVGLGATGNQEVKLDDFIASDDIEEILGRRGAGLRVGGFGMLNRRR